jgi:outer membrane protein OmpA-like peptidoglycan-associated protein
MTRRKALILFSIAAGQAVAQDSAAALYDQALKADSAEAAVALLQRSIAAGPSFEACYMLGVRLGELKRYQESLAALRDSLRLTSPAQRSDRAHVSFRQAQAYRGMGQIRVAYQYTQTSLEFEEHPVVRKYLYELQDLLAQEPDLDAKALHAEVEAAKDIDIRPAGKPPMIQVWVNFDTNQFTLTESGVRQAEVLAAEMSSAANAAFHFQVVGHTDPRGGDKINVPLSQNRAEEVRKFMLRRGVSPDRVTAEGRGSREPLRPGDTDADYRADRRVEVYLMR